MKKNHFHNLTKNKLKKSLSFFVLLLLFPFSAFCQPSKIKFDHLNSKQGLSVDRVGPMFQDSKGLIWIGTIYGLNVYDGHKFTVYQNNLRDPHSISNNSVWAISEDTDKDLWVGTAGGGLNKFDRNKGSFMSYINDKKNPASISDNNVYCILPDKYGNLWIGTENGLNKFDKKTETFTRYLYDIKDKSSLSNNSVYSLTEDLDGNIWIGTSEGLNKFDKKTDKFTVFLNDKNNPNSISDNSIWALSFSNKNILWIGTPMGLNMYDLKSGKFSKYKPNIDLSNSILNNKILSLLSDKEGILWIGTNEGLCVLNQTQNKCTIFQHDPKNLQTISDNSIWSIIEDNSGTIWVGTDGGANKYDKNSSKFSYIENDPDNENSLSENTAWAVISDKDGHVWIGTDNGLNQFNKTTGNFKLFKNNSKKNGSISDNIVLSILEDKSGTIWAGTEYALNAFDKKTGTFKIFHLDKNKDEYTSLWCMIEDTENNIWIGTKNGVYKFNKLTEKIINYCHDTLNPKSLSHNKVLSIYLDKRGDIWVGTSDGLNKFDKKTETFTIYRNEQGKPLSLSNNKIFCIFEDHEGSLWFGTDGGLNKMLTSADKHVCFKSWDKKDGLPSNKICGILEDSKNNLWLSTKKGICKFQPEVIDNSLKNQKSSVLKIHNYDTDDGLPSNEFYSASYFKGKEGTMYFGCTNGVVSFHPDSIRDNSFIPPVIITNFQLFNKNIEIYNEFTHIHSNENLNQDNKNNDIQSKETKLIRINGDSYLKQAISETKEITLSYKDNVFSLDFAALHFSKPDKNQYSYIMEGFEEKWNYVGNKHSVTYTKLPPGDYTFIVKGSNCDGIWNNTGTSIKIIVLPPFWKTWWFRILVFLLIVFLVIFYIRWRERKLKHDKEKLEHLVKIRTAEIQKQKEEIVEKNEELTLQKEEITAQMDEIETQRDEIQEQKLLIEERNEEVMDSIRYAKRIQQAILPPVEYISKNLPEHFVLFKPRDIVSGDFFWVKLINSHSKTVSDSIKNNAEISKIIFCVADCTGHGVPGAFMSMLGNALLNEITNNHIYNSKENNEITASDILDHLRENLINALHQTGKDGEQKDGMDIALCILDLHTNQLQFAGANNPLYIIKQFENLKISQPALAADKFENEFSNQLIEVKGDKMPIGIYYGNQIPFTNKLIQLNKGDKIYLFSDGFADQFGGSRNKKYMYNQLKEFLISINNIPIRNQKELLFKTFEEWKGNNDQVDDVTVLGIQI